MTDSAGILPPAAGIELTTQDVENPGFYAKEEEGVVKKRACQLGFVLLEERFDSYFFRAVLVEGLAMAAFLYNVITVIAYNDDGQLVGIDSDKQLLIALVFGLSIFMLVYFTAGLSGGNLNPAVTFSLVIGKRISVARGICYIASQMVGAIVGTAFALVIAGSDKFNAVNGGANILAVGVSAGQALFAEILSTAMVCLAVIIGLSSELWHLMEKTGMDILLPIAVGTAIVLAHMVLIPIDGCSVNPARSFGAAVISGEWADMWIFWVGPLIGGLVAILLWELILRPPQEVSRSAHTRRSSDASDRPVRRLAKVVSARFEPAPVPAPHA
ncbi:transmembrane channel protein [Tribonema minus]|uniref:Transmembrane channel protein n=1 Tax=Tribonema minus TaxID=303371 RepID=A0A836CE69_9STRA|nr:transmembrane channel protein [Tribonema minus]